MVRHNSKRSKYTKSGVPWILVYYEILLSRKAAISRGRGFSPRDSSKNPAVPTKHSRSKIKKVFAGQQRLFRVRYLTTLSQLNLTNSSSRKLFTSTKSSFNLASDVGELDAGPG
jgi:hypothetical protein